MEHPPADQFSTEGSPDSPKRVPRDSLLLSATLTVKGLAPPMQVRVRNLSEGGLMAEYAGPGGGGDTVEIELRGVGKVQGTIAWVAEGRIGVAFTNPIDPMLARKPVSPTFQRKVVPLLKPV